MLLDLIEKHKLKSEIRKAKWEKERIKAFCPHEFVALEEYREMYHDTYEANFRTVYPAYCPLCDKTTYYNDKVDLDNELLKQRARNKHEQYTGTT